MARRHNTVRIIGGKWKGRKLAVPSAPGLRPTMDRVRETLFNWLGADVQGARVLDLFAGSGALGFEALSRGARGAILIEQDPKVAAALRAKADLLEADAEPSSCRIVCASALTWLKRNPDPLFDIAFVDPPFASSLAEQTLARLPAAPGALLYLEHRDLEHLDLGAWAPFKLGRAGDVRFGLLRPER